ncbi:uncharacterized protein FIBRA_06433 [Fibroporia radiculosa]|uniref:NAD-dependent epimerase/dehydratase domain-containing protein n=1 Tax=Fibroporia radiculosa TaxID=599839 RepID=J4H427_9APHY|nr:uncharacterized protein FIBRA_06433 [Fibroporia radiculosa]CCM04264.1 predicted protein [Fibroporia radiculosa]
MPTATSGKVLVTGANGFIALWVVRTLLEQGYAVRGTVRSEGKARHLKEVFASYGDKLEVVIVEDITKAGAFDEAVKGVDAIEHTASPFHFKADDPDELIVPAVHGTTRVLESALAYGTAVKRIVVTSSCASVMEAQEAPRVFSEVDWNNAAIAEVREKGRAATQPAKYRASKTLAEKAAWEFVEKNKDKLTWDLVVLNPPYVFGPTIHEVSAAEALNESMHDWFYSIFKGSKNAKQLSTIGSSWVDVRDLAEAHVLAIKRPEAGGERIIVSEGPWKWQDWVNVARELGADIPAGDESYDPAKTTHYIVFDTTKAGKLLDLKDHGKGGRRKFAEKNKDKLAWDLVVLNPPYVFGPTIHEVGAAEALNESMHDWFHSIFKGSKNAKQLSTIGSSWVDVRDLAEAHVLAIKRPEAGGERIIVSEGPWKWQDWVNVARELGADIPAGDESYDPAKTTHYIVYDTTKAGKLLDLKYRSIKECLADTMQDLKARGWI